MANGERTTNGFWRKENNDLRPWAKWALSVAGIVAGAAIIGAFGWACYVDRQLNGGTRFTARDWEHGKAELVKMHYDDMKGIDSRLTGVERDLSRIDATTRAVFPELNKRFDRIETDLSRVDTKLDQLLLYAP